MTNASQLISESGLAPIVDATRARLAPDDDPGLWETALTVLVSEFLRQYDQKAKGRTWILQIGSCSHWIRPHQTRWTAAGGFAYPEGYKNFLPELDWSLNFSYNGKDWASLHKFQEKNHIVLRAAIPARTARHKQAALHVKWSTSQMPTLYGFRCLRGDWRCVASTEDGIDETKNKAI